MATGSRNVKELEKEKVEKIMNIVAWKASYYRSNPHRFVNEVLFAGTNFRLRLFQKILLCAMMYYNFVIYLAARGQGKSFLTALFICVRCILYPKTQVVVTSGTLKQANEVLLKIQDLLMPQSPILRSEIKSCNIGQNDASIYFHNGSYVKTRTSSHNSRSARANIIICDEFRMIDKEIIDQVLKKFLSDPRHPGYLDRPEYSHLQERNKEIYMSSCWLKSHWSWDKVRSYTANFLDDSKKYFIAALPYQLSIMEGLLMRSQIEDEMSEEDFDFISFQMEMECMWFGDTDGSLFKYDDINRIRKIKNSYMPLKFYTERNPVPKLSDTEERILSVDVALMSSNKKKKKNNDATAIFINSAIQMDGASYQSNFVYGETFEGLTTDELGIIVMRYFYEYKCTQLVLDTNGLGIGVADFICKDQYDSETGKVYKALCVVNDDDMAMRCKVKDANRVVWSVKANQSFNSEICVLLRNGIKNGKVNMLVTDQGCEDIIQENYKNYKKLSASEQVQMKMPYVQTTMAMFELIKLDHEVKNGQIKVKEISGMRKDRYSSLAYSVWCVSQLERKLKPKNNSSDVLKYLSVRTPKASAY